MSLDIWLDWPGVTTNHLWRRGRHGVYLNPRAVVWKEETILAVRRTCRCLPAGPLSLTMFAQAPHSKHVDLDNLVKLTQDSIFAAYGEDDARVVELHVYRTYGKPRINVRVEPSGSADGTGTDD